MVKAVPYPKMNNCRWWSQEHNPSWRCSVLFRPYFLRCSWQLYPFGKCPFVGLGIWAAIKMSGWDWSPTGGLLGIPAPTKTEVHDALATLEIHRPHLKTFRSKRHTAWIQEELYMEIPFQWHVTEMKQTDGVGKRGQIHHKLSVECPSSRLDKCQKE